jgi:hypothetical protein
VLPGPRAFVGHVNHHRIVVRGVRLAAPMCNQVEPSRSDGLLAARALWVSGHGFSLPRPHLSRPSFSAPFTAGEPPLRNIAPNSLTGRYALGQGSSQSGPTPQRPPWLRGTVKTIERQRNLSTPVEHEVTVPTALIAPTGPPPTHRLNT